MSEVAIPEPLSGTEIIEAVLSRVRQQLMRDCFLSANCAYESFEGRITVQVRAVDAGRNADVDQTIVANAGGPYDAEKPGAIEVESIDEIEKEPPNVVRRESGQGVPVMTEDSSGHKETRRVHYQRRGVTKAVDKA